MAEIRSQKSEKFFQKFIIIFFLISVFWLPISGCGFKPMYGEASNLTTPTSQRANIAIANIPDRNGQMLRNQLVDRLQSGGEAGNPQYKLQITNLREQIRDLDVTIRSDTTREQMKVSADLVLIDVTTGETVLTRDLSARGSYNILENEYTSRVSRQDLRRDLIEKIAFQTERYIALYFTNL